MKNEQLKKLIKEEIKKILELEAEQPETDEQSGTAISPSDFNIQLKAIYDQLKMSKQGIVGKELELLLSIIKDIIAYTQENTLSLPISNRIINVTT
jgi:hypothetical protein